MQLKSFKYLLVIVFFLSNIALALSDTALLPKKKPILNEEDIVKKKTLNIILPKQKPGTKKDTASIDVEKKLKIKVTKIDGVIIPKNKPLIVKKERLRKVKKSKYYSDRDLNYAKQAILFMEKSNWKDAKKVANKARAKSIYNFIQWRHLLTTGNKATFTEYKQFIEKFNNFPRLDRIKYLAEHKISTKYLSPDEIINWFESADSKTIKADRDTRKDIQKWVDSVDDKELYDKIETIKRGKFLVSFFLLSIFSIAKSMQEMAICKSIP